MAHVQDRWTKPAGVDGRGRPKREPSSQWGTGKRWRAYWNDTPGVRKSKLFDTRGAAAAHLARVAVDQETGVYVARNLDRTPVGDLWPRWVATKSLRPTTAAGYRTLWSKHLEPRWGRVPVRNVTRTGVQAWANELPMSASQRRGAILLLHQLIDYAVGERMLPANLLRGMRLPQVPPTPVRALTENQVEAVAHAMAPHELEVWTLALTGIRWGEMAALRVGDLDVPRRRLLVARSYAEADGQRIIQQTKTGRVREVPVPGPLVDMLSAAAAGRDPGELLLVGPKFDGWTRALWLRRWRTAVHTVGLTGVGAHALRHTAATLAIAAGADIKVVQRLLGHSSANVTLNVYAHLLDKSLDDVADRLADRFDLGR